MDTATTTEVVVRNAPPLAVVGASFTDWFASFPVSAVLQWASLFWVLIQTAYFIYDKIRKHRNGSDK